MDEARDGKPSRPLPPAPGRALAAAFLALALALAASEWMPGPLARVEGPLLDTQFRVLRAMGAGRDGGAPVLLVGLDDASLRAAGVPLAMLHRPLGAALTRLAGMRPRAIVLDVALPVQSGDVLQPGADAALMRGLANAAAAAPLVVPVDLDEQGAVLAPHPPLLAAAGGPQALALGLLARDCDGVVRRYEPDPGHQAGAAMSTGGPVRASREQPPCGTVPSGTAARARPILPTLEALLARRLGQPSPFEQGGWIDWAAGEDLDYLPLAAFAQPSPGDPGGAADAALAARVAGHIVLVGSVLAFGDELAQPARVAAWSAAAGGLPPGLLAHAQAIRSGLGRGLVHAAPTAAAVLLAAALAFLSAWPRRARLLVAAMAFVVALALSTAWLLGGLRLPLAGALLAGLLALALRPALELDAARRAGERLLALVAPLVGASVLRTQLAGAPPGRGPIAILFVDLAGFTAWSEAADPALALACLNRWYGAILPIVAREGGTIDNFRGDGVLAVFGAPEPLSEPCARAFAAARAIHAVAATMSFPPGAPGAAALAPLRVTCGLAWGEAAFGTLGDEGRRGFTALGDAVNVAARLQEGARERGESVLLTAEFVRSLGPLPPGMRPLGPLALRGHAPVEAWAWREA